MGDVLVVGVNSDEWLTRKKGQPFMPLDERLRLIQALKVVDFTMVFNDTDGSAKEGIKEALKTWPDDEIIFANGGDRGKDNIPEMDLSDDLRYNGRLSFAFGVGGENKMNSSSWILQEWKAPKTERQWGYYRVLHEDGKEIKLKELTVEPGKALSMQRHQHRSELWFVAEGQATVYTLHPTENYSFKRGTYERFATISIADNEWHQLCNLTESPLKIIEIQYGDNCVEEDIERV
jgi:mannose-6-phosphate isomerase-like protein (cupin superfamily)